MAEKKFVVPEILPILPVRDTVLFPGAVLPLTVGRESSLALVNALQGEEKMLGVVAQLDPRVEDPAAADLHKVGTLAKDRKSTRLNSSHLVISYAVFCLKKKKPAVVDGLDRTKDS